MSVSEWCRTACVAQMFLYGAAGMLGGAVVSGITLVVARMCASRASRAAAEAQMKSRVCAGRYTRRVTKNHIALGTCGEAAAAAAAQAGRHVFHVSMPAGFGALGSYVAAAVLGSKSFGSVSESACRRSALAWRMPFS